MAHNIIMPALGMSQDTGRIVSWSLAPGDRVSIGDIVMQIETDKAVVDIEAEAEGYMSDHLAAVDEDIPVGTVVAVIDSMPPKLNAKRQEADLGQIEPDPNETASDEDDAAESTSVGETTSGDVQPTGPKQLPPSKHLIDQVILASPKLKTVAKVEGLDLGLLAEEGRPQPYHMRDLPDLRLLNVQRAPSLRNTSCKIRVSILDGTRGFSEWAESEGTTLGYPLIWAALTAFAARPALSPSAPLLVSVRQWGEAEVRYEDPDRAPLSQATPTNSGQTPQIHIRDLSGGAVESFEGSRQPAPLTIIVTGREAGLFLELIAESSLIDEDAAIDMALNLGALWTDPRRLLL